MAEDTVTPSGQADAEHMELNALEVKSEENVRDAPHVESVDGDVQEAAGDEQQDDEQQHSSEQGPGETLADGSQPDMKPSPEARDGAAAASHAEDKSAEHQEDSAEHAGDDVIQEEAGAAIPPATPPEPPAKVVEHENVPPPEPPAEAVELENVPTTEAAPLEHEARVVENEHVVSGGELEPSSDPPPAQDVSQEAEKTGAAASALAVAVPAGGDEHHSHVDAHQDDAGHAAKPPPIKAPLSPMSSRRSTPSGNTPKLPALSGLPLQSSVEKTRLGSKLAGPPQGQSKQGLPNIDTPGSAAQKSNRTPARQRAPFASPGRNRLPAINGLSPSVSGQDQGLSISPARDRSPGGGWNLYNKDTVKPRRDVAITGPTEEEKARRRQYRAEQRRREAARRKLAEEREQRELQRREEEEISRLEARRVAIRDRIQKQHEIAAKMAQEKTKSEERVARDVSKFRKKPLHIRLLEEFEQARAKEEEEKKRQYDEEIGAMRHVRPHQIITGEVVVKPAHSKALSPTRERPMVFDMHPKPGDANVRRSQTYLTTEKSETDETSSKPPKPTWKESSKVHGPVLYSMGTRGMAHAFSDRAVSPMIFGDNGLPVNVPSQETFWPSQHKAQVLAVDTSCTTQLQSLPEDDDAPQMCSPTGSAAVHGASELEVGEEDSKLEGVPIDFGDDDGAEEQQHATPHTELDVAGVGESDHELKASEDPAEHAGEEKAAEAEAGTEVAEGGSVKDEAELAADATQHSHEAAMEPDSAPPAADGMEEGHAEGEVASSMKEGEGENASSSGNVKVASEHEGAEGESPDADHEVHEHPAGGETEVAGAEGHDDTSAPEVSGGSSSQHADSPHPGAADDATAGGGGHTGGEAADEAEQPGDKAHEDEEGITAAHDGEAAAGSHEAKTAVDV